MAEWVREIGDVIFGKELVLESQERHDIPNAIAIVVRSGHQIMLTDSADRFFKKVEFGPFDDGTAQKIHPAGRASPVVLDPLVRFGKPSGRRIQGRTTYSVDEAAILWGLPRSTVHECLKAQETRALRFRSQIVIPVSLIKALLSAT